MNNFEENNFTTVKVIAKTYKGFQYKIKNNKFIKMNFDEIVNETKTVMKSFFKQHNLTDLENGIDVLEFHFHDDIPFNRPIIYLCDNDHGN